MSYILDTSAWIEYFEGSETGKKVNKLLESDADVYTPSIVVAEISDNFHRKDLINSYSWKQVRNFVETRTEILGLSTEIAAEAGRTKSEERNSHPQIGLADVIVLETARLNDLQIVSKDKHLNGREESLEI